MEDLQEEAEEAEETDENARLYNARQVTTEIVQLYLCGYNGAIIKLDFHQDLFDGSGLQLEDEDVQVSFMV